MSAPGPPVTGTGTGTGTGTIDAHHHVWDPGCRQHDWLAAFPALQRAFSIDDFRAVSAAEQVTASVLVQVLADTGETEEFLGLAASRSPVAAVVGWADLTGPDVAGEIARLRGLPGGDRLAGIRHLVQDEPDPSWLARPAVRRGLRAVGAAGLCFDLLVRPGQLAAAIEVAGDLDSMRFVLDHGGKPAISPGQREPWARQVTKLAGYPNVSCKLSGLVTEAGPGWVPGQIVRPADRAPDQITPRSGWEPGCIAPYAGWLLDCFGPGRLMFGSDWPVCTLAASYGQVAGLTRALLHDHLSPAELDAVLRRNAAATYGVPLPVG
jgi:L-fuconolactonase